MAQVEKTTILSDIITTRRTVPPTSLRPEPVTKDIVSAAIETARWAPNHHLTEPWRFYLLDKPRQEQLGNIWQDVQLRQGAAPERAKKKADAWRGAPGVMVMLCESATHATEVTRLEDYAACSAAAQNFLLALWSAGVSSKWSSAPVWQHEGFAPLLARAQPVDLLAYVGVFFYGYAGHLPTGRRKRGLAEVLTDFQQ